MRTSNANYDTYNTLAYKTPWYIIKFDPEDFEDWYTETDPNSRISISDQTITYAGITTGEDAYVYRDMGTDYFSGNFVHQVEVKVTSLGADSLVYFWALTNTVNDMQDIWSGGGDFLGMNFFKSAGINQLRLTECNAGSNTHDIYTGLTENTTYYVTIKRDTSAGTQGTIYAYIYSDADRTTLVDTLTNPLASDKDYRYLFAFNSWNSGGAATQSGVVSNLVLGADYTNHKSNAAHHHKDYLASLSGGNQRVEPEQGKASISGMTFGLLDCDDEITKRAAGDYTYFHRRKTTIKGGYLGMDEADMLDLQVGWVTALKMDKNLLTWQFTVTDPQKYMQRKIFRGATEASPVTIGGNPLNILLACLISTGNGTEGTHDYLAATDALAIGTDFINVSNIEAVRDDWYPGISFSMTITKPIVAKKFFEKEIFQPLGLYPATDADGKFNVKPLKPPLVTTSYQEFDEDVIIGLPDFDLNLKEMINECEFHYDYDATDDEYDTIELFANSDSINNRGPGSKSLVIKSKGIQTTLGGANFVRARKDRIFQRFAIPPPKVSFSTFFSRGLSEAGDVVPFTHASVPDVESGTRGFTSRRMEIINRSINPKKGTVKFELLDTGFARNVYGVISPEMVVTSGTSTTVFDVSAADAAKYKEGWVIDIFRPNMVAIQTDLEITDITGTQVTVGSSIGATPWAGCICQFSTYDNVTDEQKLYSYLSDDSDQLGTDNDDAILLVA